jgi:hypothetical protein
MPKIGSDFTDAAFRADMRVSEQNRSEPLGSVGESKDLSKCIYGHAFLVVKICGIFTQNVAHNYWD